MLHIPPEAVTLAGFREWVKSDDFPEKLRATFIDGEIFLDRTKEQLESHNKVKAEICRVLLNLNKQERLGHFYTDGALITNEDAVVSNNPDGVFVSRESIATKRVRFVAGKREEGFIEIEGRPDWVLEVVSASSVGKDTKKLRTAYHRARILEYWLVDARGPEIQFEILTWRKAGYERGAHKDGWQQSKTFGHAFRLVRQKDDLGLWEYTLETRKSRRNSK